MLKRKNKAQSLGEYVMLVTVVLAFAAVMFPMVKRSTQAFIKVGADQIGSQQNAEQDFNAQEGYTVSYNTTSSGDSLINKTEWAGTMQTVMQEQTETTSGTYTNLGFSEER